MAVLPPQVHTYHCICTSLLLATTHTLSTLPRRAPPSLDNAYILPVPSQPPSFTPSRSPSPSPSPDLQDPPSNPNPENEQDTVMQDSIPKPMPAQGYTLLLGLQQDPKLTIIRREDGFEKRLLWRCMRCRVVVGYEITGLDREADGFEGKVVYLLPNGILGTDVMVKGKKILEEDVELGDRRGVGVWE